MYILIPSSKIFIKSSRLILHQVLFANFTKRSVTHLINKYVEHNNGHQRAPKVGDDESHAEHLVGGPRHVARFRVKGGRTAVAPAEDRCEKEGYGYGPREQYHDDDLVGGAPLAVLGGHLHRAKSIYRNEEHGEDGCQIDRVVDAQPHVAHELPERPLAYKRQFL